MTITVFKIVGFGFRRGCIRGSSRILPKWCNSFLFFVCLALLQTIPNWDYDIKHIAYDLRSVMKGCVIVKFPNLEHHISFHCEDKVLAIQQKLIMGRHSSKRSVDLHAKYNVIWYRLPTYICHIMSGWYGVDIKLIIKTKCYRLNVHILAIYAIRISLDYVFILILI